MADEATRKTPLAIVVSTAPDVCKTPSGPALVPVPYPIVGVFNQSTATKSSVLFTGQEAFTTGSKIVTVKGDEAGVGGGVKSGVNVSTCEFISYSSTVFAERENVVRHNDRMWMNNRNTVGKVNFPIGQSANVSPSGGIPNDTDPKTEPETPAEETAKQEKKGFWESAWKGAKENVQGKWEGIKDAASDPGKAIGDFAGGVKEAVMHPVETAKKVGGAIKDTAQEAYDAYQTGDMEKLGQMAGSGAVELGIGAIGTKGLDKLGKAAKLGTIGKKLPGGDGPDLDAPKKPDTNVGAGGTDGTVVTSSKYWNKATMHKGVKVYQRDDLIDPNKVDARGRTNLQRMEKGLAPIGPDGKPINLHHTTQMHDGPIAEMTQTFHQQNSKTIHINPSSIPSGIDRNAFNSWKRSYWQSRATGFR